MDERVVLVPLDGSELAEGALPIARALTEALGGTLRLITVVDTGMPWPRARATAEHDQLLEGERAQAERYLHEQAAALNLAGRQAAVLLAQGEPVEQLLAAAAEPDVAFVAMATHGRGGLQRWYLGSVADKLMRLAPCPVLLITPDPDADPAAAAPLRRIAVPLDGSELAEAALPIAAHLAERSGAALQLVRAQPLVLTATAPYPYVPEIGDVQAEVEAADEVYLQRQQNRFPSLHNTDTVLLRGSAVALIEYFKQEPPDLVVMTTHGRGGIKRLVLGSTADRSVRAGLPTLLLRPDVRPGELLQPATGTETAPA